MSLRAEPSRGTPTRADWARELARAVSRFRVRAGHGLRLTETPNGAVISLAQPRPAPVDLRGWPFGPQYAFGLRLGGASAVIVYPGAIEYGGSVVQTAETAITITAHGQYIGLALNRVAGTATITGPHASRPASDDTYYRTALYVMGLNASTPPSTYLLRECIHDLRMEAII